MATPTNQQLAVLNRTDLQKKDPALYQVIKNLISNLSFAESLLNIPTPAPPSPPLPPGAGINQLTGDVLAGPGSGSQVATISPNAVTLDKIQQITTNTALGRDTAGTGDVEEVTISQELDWIDPGGGVLGDLIYRASLLWLRLAGNITTTKKFLTQTGDGSNSAAPDWNTLSSTDLPNTAVTPGTYGDATHVGQFTVDQHGRLIAAANVAITYPAAPPSTSDYVVMSDGATPTPNPVNDGFGGFIYILYTP